MIQGFKKEIEKKIEIGESIMQEMVALKEVNGDFTELRKKMLKWSSDVYYLLSMNYADLFNNNNVIFNFFELKKTFDLNTCFKIMMENLYKLKIINVCKQLSVDLYYFLDVENYSIWMSCWANDGEATIPIKQYENLRSLLKYLNEIGYMKDFMDLNLLLVNLSILLKDYLRVCDTHIKKEYSEENYCIDRFYIYESPSPQRLLLETEYKEYVCLIADLSFELTRLLNLIFEKISRYMFIFGYKYNPLVIEKLERKDVEYRDEEKILSPYLGLKQFVEVTRFSRNKRFGNTKDITTLNLPFFQKEG